MKTYVMEFEVEIWKGEDGWFVVECPSIQGCISQGRTIDEAIKNIKEAIEVSLEPKELKKARPIKVRPKIKVAL